MAEKKRQLSFVAVKPDNGERRETREVHRTRTVYSICASRRLCASDWHVHFNRFDQILLPGNSQQHMITCLLGSCVPGFNLTEVLRAVAHIRQSSDNSGRLQRQDPHTRLALFISYISAYYHLCNSQLQVRPGAPICRAGEPCALWWVAQDVKACVLGHRSAVHEYAHVHIYAGIPIG